MIVGPEAGPGFNRFFGRARCSMVDTVDKADLVVFTGGASDVTPRLYSDSTPHLRVHSGVAGEALDKEWIKVFRECQSKGVAMFGVCRGAQFLHVMHGGRLVQHVDGHNSAHTMRLQMDNDKRVLSVSSVHHQLCEPNDEMIILGTASVKEATTKHLSNGVTTENHVEVEAFCYDETGVFGVQGHPEYEGYPAYSEWCLKTLNSLFVEHPEIRASKGGKYRFIESFVNDSEYKEPKRVADFYKETN